MLRAFPFTERWFEKAVVVKKLDIFDVDRKTLSSFISKLDDNHKTELISRAGDAILGKIIGFSSIELDYGSPINWHLHPISGKVCDKNKKWFQIPDFDSARGDIKVVWEASRFSHFILFARAYLLTGDLKYYQAFSRQLDSWVKENPYSHGANFKCGQECALRMINALFAYSVFKDSCDEDDRTNLKIIVEGSYRKILSNFFYAYKCIKNNHTLSELVGMVIGAWCCEDDRVLKSAYKKLDEVISEQFLPDGGYRQYSFNYQRLALQDMECILSISPKVGYALSANCKDRILKSALLLYQCQNDDGDLPNYGSNDGALIFPLTSCGYRDFKPVINTIYALLKGGVLYADGIHEEELIWFGLPIGMKRDSTERDIRSYDDAGLYLHRDGRSHSMIVLNDYHSRPAHMDQLHLDLWVDGINVFCDSGTYSYASELGRSLATTIAHNCVKVIGRDQMNTYGPFMITDWTKRVFANNDVDRFIGKYKSANGYSHEREILYRKNSLVVIDRVDADDFQVNFHTSCEIIRCESGFIFLKDGTEICRMRTNGLVELIDSYGSLYYLQKDRITRIQIAPNNKTGVLETEIIYS